MTRVSAISRSRIPVRRAASRSYSASRAASWRAIAVPAPRPHRRRRVLELQPPRRQPQALDLVVDVADRPALEGPQPLPLLLLPRQERRQRPRHCPRAARQDARAVAQLDEVAVEVPPLQPFEEDRLGRAGLADDVLVLDPGEVEAVDVAVAGLDAQPRHGRHVPPRRRPLDLPDLAQELAPVAQRQLRQVLLPEVAEPVERQKDEDADDEQQVQRQGAAAEPGERPPQPLGALARAAEELGRLGSAARAGHSAPAAAGAPARPPC